MSDFKLRGYRRYEHPFGEGQIPPVEDMGKKTPQNRWKLPELNLRSIDASDMDLSGYDMQDIAFGEGTVWPKDLSKCPKGYERQDDIIEFGKNPGLGIRSLHKKGIDGSGMRMAIIDQPLSDHVEYHDNLVHYEEIGYGQEWIEELGGKKADDGSMHGSAVASIAVGKNCGIAPKAKLYYFAAELFHTDENGQIALDKNKKPVYTAEYYAKALDRVLQINKSLPDKEKIQVVSISWGAQEKEGTLHSDLWKKTLEKAKKEGLFVLTPASREEYGLGFSGMGKKVLSDPDEPTSYCDDHFNPPKEIVKKMFVNWYGENFWDKHKKQNLLIPMNHRTTASPVGESEYVHYFKGGQSWATPWLAGMFVLARQVNPNITPEQFWEVAAKTGVNSDILGIQDSGILLGNIIQPQKLIEDLQKEKGSATLKKILQNGSDQTVKDVKMKGKKYE